MTFHGALVLKRDTTMRNLEPDYACQEIGGQVVGNWRYMREIWEYRFSIAVASAAAGCCLLAHWARRQDWAAIAALAVCAVLFFPLMLVMVFAKTQASGDRAAAARRKRARRGL